MLWTSVPRQTLATRREALQGRSQPQSLGDLVTPLHHHSSELHQAEKGEQVHKIVEDEHL
jgi:hypothetical protein